MPYNHGTMFRRAIEEGILDPARVTQAGIRELCELDPGEFAERVRARVGDGPTFLSFDVDFVDGAFLPGTGTPEIGGPTPHQALQYLRALDGLSFRGCDLVAVSPPYDGPGQMTALFGAQAVFEMLSLVARARALAA